jgi:hypothetical protein
MMEKINAIPTKTKQELEKFKANPTIENWGMSFDEKRELWAKISQMTDEYSTFYDNLLVASDGQDAIDNGKNIGEVIWAMSTDAMNNRLYVQNKLLNIIISMPIDTTFKDNKSMRKLNMYERLIEWRNEPKEE